jgi:hypothetical protein
VEERRFQRRVKASSKNSTGLKPTPWLPMSPRCCAADLRQFSVERLLRFLVALDQDVHIVVKPHHNRKNAPALQVF